MIYVADEYNWHIDKKGHITGLYMNHWLPKCQPTSGDDEDVPSNFLTSHRSALSFLWRFRPTKGHVYCVTDGIGEAKLERWLQENDIKPLDIHNIDIFKTRFSHPASVHSLYEFGQDDAGMLFKLTWRA